MVLGLLIAWLIDVAMYALIFLMVRFIPGCSIGGKAGQTACGAFTGFLTGLEVAALYAAGTLIFVSIPWVVLTVVVSFLEMRRAAKSTQKEH